MSAYPSDEQVEARLSKIRQEAESGGYQLNPDLEFVKMLVEGLLVNEQRYGYPSCPCRIASGVASEDLDIVCPCDYRDPDLAEYEACYCALYVSQAIAKGIKKPKSIPERRPPPEQRTQPTAELPNAPPPQLPYPVWRRRGCGHPSPPSEPPGTCPICKAEQQRFHRLK